MESFRFVNDKSKWKMSFERITDIFELYCLKTYSSKRIVWKMLFLPLEIHFVVYKSNAVSNICTRIWALGSYLIWFLSIFLLEFVFLHILTHMLKWNFIFIDFTAIYDYTRQMFTLKSNEKLLWGFVSITPHNEYVYIVNEMENDVWFRRHYNEVEAENE